MVMVTVMMRQAGIYGYIYVLRKYKCQCLQHNCTLVTLMIHNAHGDGDGDDVLGWIYIFFYRHLLYAGNSDDAHGEGDIGDDVLGWIFMNIYMTLENISVRQCSW